MHAAEQAQHKAISLLSEGSAEANAEAEAQVALADARLEQASTSMKAAVDTGSKAAVDAFSDFTARTVRLVGSLATTASATTNATVNAGADNVNAVDTQITTAKGVVATTGQGVLNTLTQVRAELPASITASVGGGKQATVSPAVPQASGAVSADASVSASGSANASTTPASAGVVGSATPGGDLGAASMWHGGEFMTSAALPVPPRASAAAAAAMAVKLNIGGSPWWVLSARSVRRALCRVS